MTTLGATANSGAARCPRDPGGTNHLSRSATVPTRYYLEGRTLPGLLSLWRVQHAPGHTPDSPLAHTCSLTRTAWRAPGSATGWEPGLGSHWFETRLKSSHTLAPFSTIPAKSAHPYSSPGYTRYSRSFPSHPITHPHPFTRASAHKKCPLEPSGQRSQLWLRVNARYS